MHGTSCAHSCLRDGRAWADFHFRDAELGDRRRSRRLVEVAAATVQNPNTSLPKQMPDWSDLIAGYRFLSNDSVEPLAILGPHLRRVRAEAATHPAVLCVQDDTQLDFTNRTDLTGLGQIGNGFGKGLLQHSSLAVLPGGKVLGLLDVAWHAVAKSKKGETRRERQARWQISDVWQEAAESIGPWAPGASAEGASTEGLSAEGLSVEKPPADGSAKSMLIHVGDRHADLFRFLSRATELGHHFVVRAMHDRKVIVPGPDATPAVDPSAVDPSLPRLWETVSDRPVLGRVTVDVGAQRDKGNRLKREARSATLELRVAPVELPPPTNDPRTKDGDPLHVWAIHLVEKNPPDGQDPVQWMLLSSLPAVGLEQALTLVDYYVCRWVIEEWHRCLKQGCRIEDSQLDQAKDVQRLCAIKSVQAVRLLQLRDLADAVEVKPAAPAAPAAPATPGTPAAKDRPAADDHRVLLHIVPPLYLLVIAGLAKVKPEQMTPRLLLLTIAKRGGYLARKHDARPGWIVLWRGWTDVVQMAQGAELYRSFKES